MDRTQANNKKNGDKALTIRPGILVIMDYRVRLKSGKVVDSSEKSGGPVRFVCGQGYFPPPVEEAIMGMAPGDEKIVRVEPAYAYGKYDPRKQLLVAMERVSGTIEPGKIIKALDEFGIRRPAVVRNIFDGALLVDFNHPLAGRTLYFEILIRETILKDADTSKQKDWARRHNYFSAGADPAH